MSRSAHGFARTPKKWHFSGSCGLGFLPGLEARRVALAGLLFLLSGAVGARLPGRLAAHPRLAQWRGPLLGGDDRRRLHGRARHRQPSRRTPERAHRGARRAAALRDRRARDRPLRRGEPVPLLRLALPARSRLAEPLARRGARAPRRAAAPDAAHGHVAAAARARDAARRRARPGARSATSTGSTCSARRPAPSPRPGCSCPCGGIPGAVTVAAARQRPCRARRARRSRAPRARPRRSRKPRLDAVRGRRATHPFGLWLSLYALSGFVALSLEILWFRLVDVAVKSTAFTFGTVLGDLPARAPRRAACSRCLASLACASRSPRSCSASARSWSLAGLSVIALVRASADGTPVYAWLVEYWGTYRFFRFGHATDAGAGRPPLRGAAALPVRAAHLLMGFAFPVLQRAVHDEVRTSGRKVGALQAANIAGCVAGSLLVGLAALQYLGTAGDAAAADARGPRVRGRGMRYYGPPLRGRGAGARRSWRSRCRAARSSGAGSTARPSDSARSSRRTRPASSRSPRAGRCACGLGERQGQQLAAVRRRPHRARGAAGGDPPGAAPGGGGGPGLRRHGLGRRLRRETESVTVFEISSPQPRILRRIVAAAEPARARELPGRSARGDAARGRPARARGARAARSSTRSRRTRSGPRARAAATSTRSSSSRPAPGGCARAG